jgi:UDP-N-acetylmuramoyl-L-alanyl-D-glutamate--2,6-diaminopimelate ligase
VYKTLKDKKRKLICVLGSAGGRRDHWKRPEMGKLADEWCDDIILTNEDPYDEDPELIIKDIEKGIKHKKATIIIDREEAIRAGVAMAGPDDTVIITGKGSEPLMMLSLGKKIAWDDRNVVQKVLGSLEK